MGRVTSMNDGWIELPLSSLVDRVTQRNTDGIERVYTVSARQGLVDQETYFNKRVASSNIQGYWLVKPGDYVFNKSYSEGFPLGVVARNTDGVSGVVSPLYIVMRPKPDAPVVDGWLDLAFQSTVYFESLQGLMKEGGRAHGALNVKLADYFTAVLPVPPLGVQRRIVDLMAHLDDHISNLRQECEAASSFAEVLRRKLLAPTDGWAYKPLGAVADVRLGRMLSKDRANGDDLAPYLRNANVQWSGLDLVDLKSMSFPMQERKTYALTKGDILVCEGGDPGRSVLLVQDLPGIYYQKALHRVRVTSEVIPSYLYQWIRRCYEGSEIADLCTNTTIKHLTAEKFRTLNVAFPDEQTQRQIVEALSAQQDLVACLSAEMSALREVRNSLLARLLSGDMLITDSYDRLLDQVA